jgi:hypothetical protein
MHANEYTVFLSSITIYFINTSSPRSACQLIGWPIRSELMVQSLALRTQRMWRWIIEPHQAHGNEFTAAKTEPFLGT